MYFRKRLGKKGIEKIFKHSIDKHDGDALDDHVSVDTTVQEKNITYPTDSKLQKRIIDKCVKIGKEQDIVLRRSYKRKSKQLVRDTYNGTHPKRRRNISTQYFSYVFDRTNKMIQKQALVVTLVNMFAHKHKCNYLYEFPEAEPRGIQP